MARITPQIHFQEPYKKTEHKFYKTYHKDLLPDIKNVLEEKDICELTVYRSKRGQWGEWFEVWKLDYKREPYIDRQGWS